jgi:glycosyltransferase involved in cell wall biosynthesis
MRVLLAHNFYSSRKPSGENLTVQELHRGFAEAGLDVHLYGPSNDDVDGLGPLELLGVAARPVWPFRRRPLAELVEQLRPDVVQVHNVYPFIAPRELRDLVRRGVPVSHVIHNYRHSCIAGTHFRDGAACFDCSARRHGNLAAVRHACFRGSVSQSALMAISNTVHHSTWRSLDYVCISEHMRRYLLAAGFPPERTAVIPNPVGSVHDAVAPSRGDDVLFAGRLEREKGVRELLDAWAGLDATAKGTARLHIAGSGPESERVEAAARSRADVVHHGQLTPAELEAVAAGCKASVVPSTWDEPFGRTVIEAFRAGRGVVVSARGALPELVTHGTTGWIAGEGVAGLREALAQCLAEPAERIGPAAQRAWRENYTREAVAARYAARFAHLVRSERLSRGVEAG